MFVIQNDQRHRRSLFSQRGSGISRGARPSAADSFSLSVRGCFRVSPLIWGVFGSKRWLQTRAECKKGVSLETCLKIKNFIKWKSGESRKTSHKRSLQPLHSRKKAREQEPSPPPLVQDLPPGETIFGLFINLQLSCVTLHTNTSLHIKTGSGGWGTHQSLLLAKASHRSERGWTCVFTSERVTVWIDKRPRLMASDRSMIAILVQLSSCSQGSLSGAACD